MLSTKVILRRHLGYINVEKRYIYMCMVHDKQYNRLENMNKHIRRHKGPSWGIWGIYGLPKIHKKDIPLRPTVSSRGSVTYRVDKELARILKPLTARTICHVSNTKDVCRWDKEQQTRRWGMHHFLSCIFFVYIHTSDICNWHNKEQAGIGYRTPQPTCQQTSSQSCWDSVC